MSGFIHNCCQSILCQYHIFGPAAAELYCKFINTNWKRPYQNFRLAEAPTISICVYQTSDVQPGLKAYMQNFNETYVLKEKKVFSSTIYRNFQTLLLWLFPILHQLLVQHKKKKNK